MKVGLLILVLLLACAADADEEKSGDDTREEKEESENWKSKLPGYSEQERNETSTTTTTHQQQDDSSHDFAIIIQEEGHNDPSGVLLGEAVANFFQGSGSDENEEQEVTGVSGRKDGGGEESDNGECMVSFKVPMASLHCSNNNVDDNVDEQNKQMLKEMLEVKGAIENMKEIVEAARDDIIKQQQEFPPVYQITQSISTVDRLKQESRNSNERVNQLYMQLMHEIINKRDHQLDYEKLNAKILEQRVHFQQVQESVAEMRGSVRELEERSSDQLSKIKTLERERAAMGERVAELERLCRQNANKINAAATRQLQLDELREESNVGSADHQQQQQQPPPAVIVVHDEINDQPPPTTTTTTPTTTIPTTTTTTTPATTTTSTATKPVKEHYRDCSEVQRGSGWNAESGIYRIRANGMRRSVKVWCDFDLDPGGWIVIQKRTEGRTDFNRNYAMYRRGFGRVKNEYWLGLENLHLITSNNSRGYKLHVELEDWEGNWRFAEYESFRVESERYQYQLNIAHYSGNAGDSMTRSNHMRFTTKDVDRDNYEANCAQIQRGGWWHNSCGDSNLNGNYYNSGRYDSGSNDGIYWSSWHGYRYSLRSVIMMIRPND